jgi:U1 small nuclear ribonucleoprotein
MYGKIERIRIVKDKKGKSKSYAFIVYERERDMKGNSERVTCVVSANIVSDSRLQRRRGYSDTSQEDLGRR